MGFERGLRPGEEVIYESKLLRVTKEPEGGQCVDMSFEGKGFIGPRDEVISNENGALVFGWPKGEAGTVVWERGAAQPVFIEGGVVQAPRATFAELMEEFQREALRQMGFLPIPSEENQS